MFYDETLFLINEMQYLAPTVLKATKSPLKNVSYPEVTETNWGILTLLPPCILLYLFQAQTILHLKIVMQIQTIGNCNNVFGDTNVS